MMLLILLALVLGFVSCSTDFNYLQDSDAQPVQQFHKKPTTNPNNPSAFQVVLDPEGHYLVTVGGQLWLRSAPTFVTVNGKHCSSRDGTLRLIQRKSQSGKDTLGVWTVKIFLYQPLRSKVRVEFKVRWYQDLQLVLFGQNFLTPVDGSSVGDRNAVSSGFPSFYVEDAAQTKRSGELGYLAFGGIMTGDTEKSIGIWANHSVDYITSGLDSGPLVLFDEDDQAIIISPFTNFMAASAEYKSRGGAITVTWGLLGSANHIPENFSYWTAIMYSGKGVNKLMTDWGAVMRRYYNKDTSYTESDPTNNYIGYWTDRGGYYYYLTEGKLNYEDTILAIKENARSLNLPYRNIEYDSWFYPKGPQEGAIKWDSTPDIFPHGLRHLWQNTRWPVVGHNRWWSNATIYAKQNGGAYNFIVESKTGKALPLDQEFWNDLLSDAKTWGLSSYEQDWLNYQFNLMDATVEDLTLGRQWLHQMGNGASRAGINIQYCMSPSRHALTSLEIQAVTQTRVSEDYMPGNDNWRIGVTSMLAHALGLAPYKDNFWTTETQPGNVYNGTEPHSRLHSLAATLSTGPVTFCDKINYTERTLLLRSCNADGLILKPSLPAMAVNKQFKLAAYGGFSGEVWSTNSLVSGLRFGITMAAAFNISDVITVSPDDVNMVETDMKLMTFPHKYPEQLAIFSRKKPLTLSDCTRKDFCLHYVSPVIKLGNGDVVVILGELDKWVPVSPQRVTAIELSTDAMTLQLAGADGEQVTFTFVKNGAIKTITCVMNAAGLGSLDTVKERCVPVY